MQVENKNNLEALHKQYNDKISELNRLHDEELNKLKQLLEDLRKQKDEEVKKHRELLEAQKKQHEETTRKMEDKYKDLYEDLK